MKFVKISILQAMSVMHKAMNLRAQTLQDAYMFSDNDNTKQTYTTQYKHFA